MLVRSGSGWGGSGFRREEGLGLLPPGAVVRGAGALRPPSAGSSPHPSLTEEDDSQAELLIAEEKLSPEQEGQLMPR